MSRRYFYVAALSAALMGYPLGAYGQLGIGGGIGGGGGGRVGGNVGGNVGGGVRAGGNIGGSVRSGANVGGVRAGTSMGGVRAGTTTRAGVRANVGGVRAGTTAGAGVRANVPGVRANVGGVRANVGTSAGVRANTGVRAGANIDGVRAGANVDGVGVRANTGVRAGANIDGVRAGANVGTDIGARANIAGRTGVGVGAGPVGIRVGDAGIYHGFHYPWWRYGHFHAGIYYPGWWWWNNRWYDYPPAGYAGYYGGGYAGQSYAETTEVAAEYNGPGVAIRNSAEHDMNFTLDGEKQMTAAAGETIRLTEFPDYQISFDRGDNFGTATYTVFEGVYEFTPTDRGWELYRLKDDAEARTAERPMTPAPPEEAPPEDAPRSELPAPPRAGAPY